MVECDRINFAKERELERNKEREKEKKRERKGKERERRKKERKKKHKIGEMKGCSSHSLPVAFLKQRSEDFEELNPYQPPSSLLFLCHTMRNSLPFLWNSREHLHY
jgi:hypothetical protein